MNKLFKSLLDFFLAWSFFTLALFILTSMYKLTTESVEHYDAVLIDVELITLFAASATISLLIAYISHTMNRLRP